MPEVTLGIFIVAFTVLEPLEFKVLFGKSGFESLLDHKAVSPESQVEFVDQ